MRGMKPIKPITVEKANMLWAGKFKHGNLLTGSEEYQVAVVLDREVIVVHLKKYKANYGIHKSILLRKTIKKCINEAITLHLKTLAS